MQCTRCHCHFCWKCGEKILDRNPYDHFQRGCEQFDGAAVHARVLPVNGRPLGQAAPVIRPHPAGRRRLFDLDARRGLAGRVPGQQDLHDDFF